MSSISVRFNSFLSLFDFQWTLVNLLIDLVGLDGLEPSTSRLSGVRSNHLSYRPFPFGGSPFVSIGNPLPRMWWRWWGSNPWPPACRAGALPAELHPRIYGFVLFQWSLTKLASFLILENWTTKVPYKPSLKTSLVNRLRSPRERTSWSP